MTADRQTVEIRRTVTIDAPPATVWNEVRDFDSLVTWHPDVESSELLGDDGLVRRLTVAGGRVELHRLVELDDDDRSYTYVDAEEPPGAVVSGYRSTLRVLDAGSGSVVEWTATFHTANTKHAQIAESLVTTMYDAGLQHLKRHLDRTRKA